MRRGELVLGALGERGDDADHVAAAERHAHDGAHPDARGARVVERPAQRSRGRQRLDAGHGQRVLGGDLAEGRAARGGRVAAWICIPANRDLRRPSELALDHQPLRAGCVAGLALGAIAWLASSHRTGVTVFVACVAIAFLVGMVRRIFVRFTITDQRLRIQRGIISRAVQQTRIDRVQNVNTRQSPVERMLRVGTVDFDTAGARRLELRVQRRQRPGGGDLRRRQGPARPGPGPARRGRRAARRRRLGAARQSWGWGFGERPVNHAARS